MISNKVVYRLENRVQSFAVIFFFEQEFVFREYLYQIDEPIASFLAKLFDVGSDIGENSNNGLVDGFEESRPIMNELVHEEEEDVCVGALLETWHVQLHTRERVVLVQIHREISRLAHRQQQEDAQVHQVALRRVLLALVQLDQDPQHHLVDEVFPLSEVLKHVLR